MTPSKNAICLFGHIRAFEKNKDSFVKFVKKENPTADLFIHTYYQQNTDSGKVYTHDEISNVFFDLSPIRLIIEDQDLIFEKIKSRASSFLSFPEYERPFDNSTLNLYCQVRKIEELHNVVLEYEKENDVFYEKMIYTRPDILFKDKISFDDITVPLWWYMAETGTPDPCDVLVGGTRKSIDAFIQRKKILDNLEFDKEARQSDGQFCHSHHWLGWKVSTMNGFGWKWNRPWKASINRL
jgi:hypothetical protein